MRIKCLTAVYNRPELDQVFLKQVERFNKGGIDTVIIGSQNEPYASHQFPNSPLGDKWNYGLTKCKDADYVLLMGSDDFMPDSELIKLKQIAQREFDLIGFLDIYFYENKLMYWHGYTNKRRGESVGAGRMVSKRVLKYFNYKMWEPLERNLDGSFTNKINKLEHSEYMHRGGLLLDVKYKHNLTELHRYKGCRPQGDRVFSSLPEYESIKALFK